MGKVGAKGDSYYGKVASNYQRRRAKQEWWGVEQLEMQDILSALPDGLSVLDVPFGTGRFVPYYHDHRYTVFGLDASGDMIETAKAELGEKFNGCKTMVGSAMDLPFPDASFDMVSSVRFIRDIIVKKDAMRALSEFARVTRKYAIIQLGQHTDGGADDVAALPDNIPLHSQLSAKGNKAMLKDLGFKITDKRRVKSDPDDASEVYHFVLEKG